MPEQGLIFACVENELEATNVTNAYSMTSTILLRSVQLNDSAIFGCAARRRNGSNEHKEVYLNVKSE